MKKKVKETGLVHDKAGDYVRKPENNFKIINSSILSPVFPNTKHTFTPKSRSVTKLKE